MPQYHPIPENDAWWGTGFTEWSNVVSARKRFRGHLQPHLPADLGFYDLRLPEARAAQAELAKKHGVDGFCYYHYWFNGKRLLQRPFEEVLSSGEPDFPFMLCWANENWTRIWDGSDREVLIAQNYSLEDDRTHIRSLLPAFGDPRYITIDRKPVFLVYRASALPDSVATTDLWRFEAERAGFPGLYLCHVESGRDERRDPRDSGFDASIEFTPDFDRAGPGTRLSRTRGILHRLRRPGQRIPFDHAYEYDQVVARALADAKPPYIRFRCVTPSWDNTARRKRGAWIFTGSTPDKYEQWLARTISGFAQPSPEEDLVFTNAWNEWAEGNHLEPDAHWGHGYLEAHARAVATVPQSPTDSPRKRV